MSKPHGADSIKAQVEVQNFRHFNTFHNLMLVVEDDVETVYVAFPLFALPQYRRSTQLILPLEDALVFLESSVARILASSSPESMDAAVKEHLQQMLIAEDAAAAKVKAENTAGPPTFGVITSN